ncbi:MAG: hypothetical protein IKS06_09410 [Lachnospiraceae bacterium]|nr:hypothetical protein [Lachnospiraceae bacterium]
MDKNILALDLGTSAIKVAIVSPEGKILATSTQEYKLLTTDTLSVEMTPETYWEAFKAGTKEALAKSGVSGDSLACLGMSAQGETFFLIGPDGKCLRNAIVWMDNRAQKEAEELDKAFPPEVTYKVTGQVSIVPTWPAAKLLWVKHHEPEIFSKIQKVLLIDDYIIYRMTGKFAGEGSLLCSTCYWDINTKKWWKEMLDYIGITEDQLPDIYEPGSKVATVNPEIAEELGISKDLVVCTGVLDQAAGTIGVGNVAPGIFSDCTGSALAICATVNKVFQDPAFQMPCHYHGIQDLYMAHTFTTGGMALKWFRDAFCDLEMTLGAQTGLDPYYLMDKEVALVPAGSDGLVMLPHLQGAMAPEANPKAKGVFFGITLKHTKAHFIRAVMEAVAFIVRRNVETVERMGMPVNEIRVLGGGSRSDIWNQIKADVTGKTYCTTENSEAACLGCAVVAGASCGLFPDVKGAVTNMVQIKKRFEPNMANHEIYNKLFEEYKQLYNDLCPLFDKAAD